MHCSYPDNISARCSCIYILSAMIKKKLTLFLKENILSANALKYDRVFLVTVILLSLYGTFMVFSAGYAYADFRYGDAYYFIKRQVIWLIIGIIAMMIFVKMHLCCTFKGVAEMLSTVGGIL